MLTKIHMVAQSNVITLGSLMNKAVKLNNIKRAGIVSSAFG